MRWKIVMTAGAILLAMFLPNWASACGCEFNGVVVAHGSSPNGVPWRIKAIPPAPDWDPRYLMLEFTVGEPEGGAGYFDGTPLPVPDEFFFSADIGTEIDEFPESDLSGFIQGRRLNGVSLEVKMDDAEVLTVYPTLAPPALRKRIPPLRRLRFFNLFYRVDQRPVFVTSFSPSGRILARSTDHQGLFYGWTSKLNVQQR